jgi:hypothetical protein
MLAACRWQFIVSGMQHVHFRHLLTSMTTSPQRTQIMTALQPVMQADTGGLEDGEHRGRSRGPEAYGTGGQLR